MLLNVKYELLNVQHVPLNLKVISNTIIYVRKVNCDTLKIIMHFYKYLKL